MAIHDPIHVFRFVKDIFIRYQKTIQFNRDKSCEVNERKKAAIQRRVIIYLWNLVNKFSLMSISHCHRPKSDRDLLGGCPQISPDLVTMTNSRGDWS